jgi:superfamily II DNA/RNA helicase
VQRAYQAGEKNSPDVLIATDAGAVGVNLQRAGWVANYDTPDTAMLHEQRIGRMERIGQTNPDIKVLDLVTRTPYEHKRRRNLEDKKRLRDIVTSPTESADDSGLAHEIYKARYGDMHREMLDINNRTNAA